MTTGRFRQCLTGLMLAMPLLLSPWLQADERDIFSGISLEDLLDLTVSLTSGVEESYRDAPAALVILTEQDIRQRGYTSFDEIVLDLPGFDTSITNGNGSVTTYQRGYRTPFTQRTLILVNGVVDNHLWTHEATFTKTYPISNIKRIEVLYGPAGAIYGPNAFLGIINVTTKKANDSLLDKTNTNINVELGSFNTQSIDVTFSGANDNFSYNLSGKYFSSDEPGIEDYAPWGFLSQDILANRDIWGPVVHDKNLADNCDANACPHSSQNEPYGQYHDRTRDWGILADMTIGNIEIGTIMWQMSEGYGPYYPADRAQPGSFWNRSSEQFYARQVATPIENMMVKTLALYRESRIWGDWAEAFPSSDTLVGETAGSWVSISDWNSISHGWLFKQDYEYDYSDTWLLSGGIKLENKRLTQAYDVCSYWADSFCSSANELTSGNGIASSKDKFINIQPDTLPIMPEQNLASTTDRGLYVQSIWSLNDWRLTAGIRYDDNNLYGSTTNPRGSAVYYLDDKSTIKIIYGTAFQEPAPIQLWGGWSGRQANPNLKPEKTQNLELIYMLQQENWLHDMSVFMAKYKNVIKEEAENAGKRDTLGFEYRGRFQLANPIHNQKLTGYLYYTYTQTKSSVNYDHALNLWVGDGIANCQQINAEYNISYNACDDMDVELGDIAPHKINFGLNLPLSPNWNLNLRGNWVSDKTLYVRNPLRAKGRKNNAYTVIDANLIYYMSPFSIALKVRNLFDESYYHSGVEGAESGDDFSQRSIGWRNSLIPQPKRHFMLTLNMRF